LFSPLLFSVDAIIFISSLDFFLRFSSPFHYHFFFCRHFRAADNATILLAAALRHAFIMLLMIISMPVWFSSSFYFHSRHAFVFLSF